jgi:hypothetical protein
MSRQQLRIELCGQAQARVGIGRQRASTEAERLRDRIGKEKPLCPLFRLVDVRRDTTNDNFPDPGQESDR